MEYKITQIFIPDANDVPKLINKGCWKGQIH